MVKEDAETVELTVQKTAVEDNGNWAVIARNTHGEMFPVLHLRRLDAAQV